MFKCDIDNSFIIAAGVDDRLKDRDLVKLVCFSQMGGSLEFWVWCSVRAPTVHKTPPAPGPARPPPSSLDDVHTTQNTAKAPRSIVTMNTPYIEFQAGVTAALRSWSALRTAVEQSWGPRGTAEAAAAAADDLRSNIFAYFDGTSPNPKLKQDELEDNLLDYMEEEFGVVLEDGSEREVADLICRMYELCGRGDVTLARSVMQSAIKAEEARRASKIKSVFQGDDDIVEEDDDGDDMEDDSDSEGEEVESTTSSVHQESSMQVMNDTTNISVVQAYALGTLFGGPTKPIKETPPPRQLGVPEPEKPKPVLDDDGFAPAQTKKKGTKRVA